MQFDVIPLTRSNANFYSGDDNQSSELCRRIFAPVA